MDGDAGPTHKPHRAGQPDARRGLAGRARSLLAFAGAAMGRAGRDNVEILAAGVAFWAFLSIFPAIAGTLLVWGVFAEPPQIREQIALLRIVAPPQAFDLVADQMIRIAEASGAGFTVSALLSFALALWSASRATFALLGLLNVAYGASTRRSFLISNWIAIRFTVVGVAFVLLSLASVAALPPILEALRLGAVLEAAIRALRWCILISVFCTVTAMAYKRTTAYRKSRRSGRRMPVLRGALVAGALWLIASALFSTYLSEFDAYNKTFGSLGAVAALLMWFWLSAYAIGVGAAVNVELDARRHPEPRPG
jgi:membrane protein